MLLGLLGLLVLLIRLPGQQSCRTAFTFPRCTRTRILLLLLQRTWSSGSGKMAAGSSTLRLRKLEIGQTSALESASPRWPKQIWNFKFAILLICSCSHNNNNHNNNSSDCNCNEQDDDEVDDDTRIEIGYRIGWPRQTGDNFALHATAICCSLNRAQKYHSNELTSGTRHDWET